MAHSKKSDRLAAQILSRMDRLVVSPTRMASQNSYEEGVVYGMRLGWEAITSELATDKRLRERAEIHAGQA